MHQNVEKVSIELKNTANDLAKYYFLELVNPSCILQQSCLRFRKVDIRQIVNCETDTHLVLSLLSSSATVTLATVLLHPPMLQISSSSRLMTFSQPSGKPQEEYFSSLVITAVIVSGWQPFYRFDKRRRQQCNETWRESRNVWHKCL